MLEKWKNNPILPQAESIWSEAIEIWLAGGWAMIAIAIVAVVMFGVGLRVYFRLNSRGFLFIREKKWRRWLENPNERRGPIGDIMNFAADGGTLKEISTHFDELRTTEVAPFERDLKVMRICVSAAPLLGLLGTVTGMLATFAALSTGSGGDKTMELVAGGISEALITTETGLVIALPGLFFQYQLARKLEMYRAFLAHLETACMQTLIRRFSAEMKKKI